MIDSKGAYINIYCDGCSNCMDTEEFNFTKAMNKIKQSGWITLRRDNEWFNFCSKDCKDKVIK